MKRTTVLTLICCFSLGMVSCFQSDLTSEPLPESSISSAFSNEESSQTHETTNDDSVSVSESLDNMQHAILNAVNDMLAGYADGTYPLPRNYGGESGIAEQIPTDTALPTSVGYSQLKDVITDMNSEANCSATIYLDNDYAMKIYMSTWENSETATLVFNDLVDLRPAVVADNSVFSSLTYTRVECDASFTELSLKDVALAISGELHWRRIENVLVITLTDKDGLGYTFYLNVDSNGKTKMNYPDYSNLDYAYPPPIDNEASALRVGESLYAILQQTVN